MDTPEQAELRSAVFQAAEEQGYRRVARQLGMSPMGVKKLGEGRPVQPRTWTKLREWYVRMRREEEETRKDAPAVLLETLLHHVAPVLRDRVRRAFLDAVGRIYGEEAMPAPIWLTEIPEGIRAYEEGVHNRRAPFAIVELTRGDRLLLEEQPIPGDPYAVIEELAAGRGFWSGNSYYPPHRIHRVAYGGEEEEPKP